MRAGRVVGGGVAAGVVAMMAACGSGGAGGSRITASGVARSTIAARSARVEITMTGTAGETTDGTDASVSAFPPTPVSVRELGVVDFAGNRGELRATMDGRQANETRWTSGRWFTTSLFPASGSPSPGSPMLPPPPKPSKPWLVLDSEASGSGPSGPGVGILDPARTLALLRAASRSVTAMGTATVRGVATTRYRFLLDRAKLEARGGAPDPAVGRGDPIADVWVDRQSRVRRFDAPNMFGELAGDFRIEFWDYGIAVDVQPPPADQVETFDQYNAEMQRQLPKTLVIPTSPPA